MKTEPVIIRSHEDTGQLLTRIEVKAGSHINEDCLQRLIFEHPEILPIAAFDETSARAVPIARELATAAGWIDNFYVSPTAGIVIAETKLWRNPEAHRTVVAQVIDYAKELSRWSYEQLNETVRKTRMKPTGVPLDATLDEMMAPHLQAAGIPIDDFQERMQLGLRNGEFVLLIIGDRISPNVAFLTDWLSAAPGLNFRLGLVELQLYRTNSETDWPLLVVPDIVGRTVERIRGVVKIQYEKEKPRVEVEYAETEPTVPSREPIDQEEFLKRVPEELAPVYERWITDWAAKGFFIYWGVSGFSIRVRLESKLQTVLDAYPNWPVSLVRKVDAEKMGVPPETYQAYLAEIRTVHPASETLALDRKYIKPGLLTADDLHIILAATTALAEKLLAERHRN